jgi:hypothetical protein
MGPKRADVTEKPVSAERLAELEERVQRLETLIVSACLRSITRGELNKMSMEDKRKLFDALELIPTPKPVRNFKPEPDCSRSP